MKRSRWTLAAALLVASCSSSRGTREPWVYGLSRGFYSSITEPVFPTPVDSDNYGKDPTILVALIALPFALDTVFLPITIPHDLFFVD